MQLYSVASQIGCPIFGFCPSSAWPSIVVDFHSESAAARETPGGGSPGSTGTTCSGTPRMITAESILASAASPRQASRAAFTLVSYWGTVMTSVFTYQGEAGGMGVGS